MDRRRNRATCVRRDDRGAARDRRRACAVAAQGRARADSLRLHDRSGDASGHRAARLVADPASGRRCCSTTSSCSPRRACSSRSSCRPSPTRCKRRCMLPDSPPGSGGGIKARLLDVLARRLHRLPAADKLVQPALSVGEQALKVLLGILFTFAVAAYWIFERDRTVDLVTSFLPRPRRKSPRHLEADRPEARSVRARRARADRVRLGARVDRASGSSASPTGCSSESPSGSSRSSRWSGRSRRRAGRRRRADGLLAHGGDRRRGAARDPPARGLHPHSARARRCRRPVAASDTRRGVGDGVLLGGFYVLLSVPIASLVATVVDVSLRGVDPAEVEVPTVIFPSQDAG